MNIFGIDEVGRGPLAGPVTICAFSVSNAKRKKVEQFLNKYEITDSKKLTHTKRVVCLHKLKELKKAELADFVTVSLSAQKIDEKGMSWCIKRAISQALRRLGATEKDVVLLDGALKAPAKFIHQETIIKGDEKEVLIGAASIVAKVKRDAFMEKLAQDKKYKKYGFEVHKGYGTKKHREVIKKYGCSDVHRSSFCRNIV